MRILTIVPLCLAAAACSGGDEANNSAALAPPATLPAGMWQVQFEVTKFASTDKSTPVLKAKVGDKEQDSSCVPEAHRAKPAPELFAGTGYSCTYQTIYVEDGTMVATMLCHRPGLNGDISMSFRGSYTADRFEGTVESDSYLTGPGDFTMTRNVQATLTPGACQPKADAASGDNVAEAKKGG